jgi:hypothetical protein
MSNQFVPGCSDYVIMGKGSRARLLVSIGTKRLGGFVIRLETQSLRHEKAGMTGLAETPKRCETGCGSKNIREARSELA